MLLPQGELAPHWRTSPCEEQCRADVSQLRLRSRILCLWHRQARFLSWGTNRDNSSGRWALCTHHAIRLSPLYSRLVIEMTWESRIRPVSSWVLAAVSPSTDKKRLMEKFIKAFLCTTNLFEELGFCLVEMPEGFSIRWSMVCVYCCNFGCLTHKCCLHLKNTSFGINWALNQWWSFLVTSRFIKKPAWSHNWAFIFCGLSDQQCLMLRAGQDAEFSFRSKLSLYCFVLKEAE